MDNKNYTQEIIEQLSQLRDLLIVIERGGDKTPDILYTLAIEKSQQVTTLVRTWRDDMQPVAVTIPEEYAVWVEGLTQEDVATTLQEETKDTTVCEEDAANNDVVEIPQSIEMEFPLDEVETDESNEDLSPIEEKQPVEEVKEVLTFEFRKEEEEVSLPNQEAEEEQAPVAEQVEGYTENQPIDEVADEEITWIDDDTVEVLEESDEIYVDDKDFVESDVVDVEDEFIGVVDDDFVDEVTDDEIIEEEDEDNDLYNRGEPSDGGVMTLGDKMTMHRAKELRKALSLNDRFRFRRELFGNKDVEMNNTLNLIDAMTDYAEAREYLLQDLGWSYEEPVVQEFMELVERHFKQ